MISHEIRVDRACRQKRQARFSLKSTFAVICFAAALLLPYQAECGKTAGNEAGHKVSSVEYNSSGMKFFEAGDYVKAADSFRRCLLEKPDFNEARFNLGVCLYMSGDYEGAIGEFAPVLKDDPGFSVAADYAGLSYLKLAGIKAEKGDVEGALKICEDYQKKPYSSEETRKAMRELDASLRLGRIAKGSQGASPSKKGSAEKTDPQRSGDGKIPVPGDSKSDSGELEAILDIIRKFPDNSQAHSRLRAFVKSDTELQSLSKSRSDGLFATLNDLVERDPKNLEAHLTLGALYRAYGQTDRAQYHYGMVRTVRPSSIEAIEGIAEIENYRAKKSEILQSFDATSSGAGDTREIEKTTEISGDKNNAAENASEDEDEEKILTPTVSGNLPKEIISIKRKIEANAAGTDDLKKAACYYLSRREFKRALAIIDIAFSLDPSDNETNYLMALVRVLQKNKKEALPFVFGINPETIQDARLLNDAGVLLIKLKKPEHAMKFFARGIETDPSYIENYLSSAIYCSQINDFDNARKFFTDALAASPGNLKVLYFSALSARREGRFEEFLDTAARIQKTAPASQFAGKIRRQMGLAPEDRLITYESEKTLIETANSYIKSKDYDNARAKLSEALRLDPESRAANLAMAEICRQRGLRIERLAYLMKVVQKRMDESIALDIARELFVLGLPEAAEDYLMIYSSRNPSDSMVRLEYAGYLKGAGRIMKARTVCEALIGRARTPLEAEAAKNMLSELEAYGTDEDSVSATNAVSMENLAKIVGTLSDFEMYSEIENLAGKYISKHEVAGALFEKYCTALLKNKKYTAAIDALKKLITFDRTNYLPYYQIGQIYMKRNNFARAEEYFRQALIYRPEDAEILLNLGDACLYQKNYEDAEVSYSEGLSAAKNILAREELKIKLEKIKAHRGAASR